MDFCREIEVFETTMRCHLAFHDYTGELTALAAPSPLALHHQNEFCERIRSAGEASYQKCHYCDVNEIAARVSAGRPFRKWCHAGVYEAVFPLKKFGKIVGVMFAGVFAETELERVETILWFGELLADHLRLKLEALPENAAGADRRDRINCWLLHNFRNPDCSLARLAGYLGVTESRTSQLLRSELGQTFPALLRQHRLACACQILTNSDLTIGEAAKLAGFRSANYLHRSFLKAFQMTPQAYRAQQNK